MFAKGQNQMTDRRSLEQNDLLQPACRKRTKAICDRITASVLNDLSYDPETGVFTWRRNGRGRSKREGAVAGAPGPRGYVRIHTAKRDLYGHRVAWLFVTGAWPSQEIDHINRDRSDNRYLNLREVSCSENRWNTMGQPSRRESIYKGVARSKGKGRWRAQINAHGQTIRLGVFDSQEEAAAAYKEGSLKYHGRYSPWA